MKSYKTFISESSGSSYRKTTIKPSGQPAMVRKIDADKWHFVHRGIMGHVAKAWSRMGGWGYQAGNLKATNGTNIDVPSIHGTHKSLNDAIHHAHEHVTYHLQKKATK